MQIEYIELSNFCQHRSLRLDFPKTGIVVIQGPNGCGKSNVVRALSFALTGSMPGVNKDLNVTWGESNGYVEVGFQHEGVQGVVKRFIASTRASLTYGESEWKSVSAVNSQLETMFGAASTLLGKFVLVRQGELNEMLLSRPTERMKLLHRLFGTDRFEKVHQALGTELTELAAIPQLLESSAQLKDRYTALGYRVAHLESELAKNKEEFLKLDASAARDKLAQYNIKLAEINHPVTGLAATAGVLGGRETTRNDLIVKLARANEQVAEYESVLQSMKDLSFQAFSLVDAADKAKATATQYATCKEQEAYVLKLLAGLSPCAAFDVKEEWHQQARNRIGQLNAQLIANEKNISSFRDGKCPTCGTTCVTDAAGVVTHLGTYISAQLEQHSQLRVERTQLDTEVAVYEKALAEHLAQAARYEQQTQTLKLQLERVQGLLSGLQLEQVDEVKVAEAKKMLGSYGAATSALVTYKTTQKDLQTQLSGIEVEYTRLSSAHARLQAIAAEVAGFDHAGPTKLLEHWAKLSEYVSNSQAMLSVEKTTQEELGLRLNRTLELERQISAQSLYRTLVMKGRDLFHREAYPAAVARLYIERINASWNEMLQLLDVPFLVRVTPSLEIALSFAGNEASAEQASGGQQCCVSLAFLLAVNRLFAQNVGLLVLDEPTYGLDSDHIDRVVDLLNEASNYVNSAGMQIFVVTHEEKLRQGFDSVISLTVPV